ncbi:hypothetical protein ACQY0O_000721 [Thecaphora frezii]
MSSPKRRRIAHSAPDDNGGDEPSELQRRLLLTALHQEAHAVHARRQADLVAGRSETHPIAWSRHNLVAYASSVSAAPAHPIVVVSSGSSSIHGIPPDVATGSGQAVSPHVVLRSLALAPLEATADGPRPCRLYPPPVSDAVHPHPLFSSTGTSGNGSAPGSVSGGYADPECIEFSPCGFYLCAYFPSAASKANEQGERDGLLAQEVHALQQIEQAGNVTSAAPSIPSLSRNPTEGLGDLGAAMNASVSATMASATAAAPMRAPCAAAPTGKLCIWSRADTEALNDWTLVQSFDVLDDAAVQAAPKTPAPAATLDGQGHVPGALAVGPTRLCGGIKRIVWLGDRRKWTMRTAGQGCQYGREASRGPAFLSSETAVGAQRDLALVAFGDTGQVTLLHSRQLDRQPGPAADCIGAFQTVQSWLTRPALVPAPPTISSEGTGVSPTPSSSGTGADDAEGKGGAAAADRYAAKTAHEVSHLAVGMLADEPVMLVAWKAARSAESSLELCEVTVDLVGEAVTMMTRPLDALALVSTWTSMEGAVLDAEAGIGGQAALTSLDWIELDDRRPGAPAAGESTEPRAASLRLLATLAASGTAVAPLAPADASTAAASAASPVPYAVTFLKAWDLLKEHEELSEAFAMLECRKAAQPAKQIEWSPRLVQTKRFDGTTFTSVLASRPLTLPTSNVIAVVAVSASPPAQDGGEATSAPQESLRYLDAESLEWLPSPPSTPSAVPPKAADRNSSPVLSPSGVLAGALSCDPPGSGRRKLVVWKLPPLVEGEQGGSGEAAEATDEAQARRAGELVALTMLRRSDAFDLSRAFFSGRSRDFITKAMAACARSLGMLGNGDGSSSAVAALKTEADAAQSQAPPPAPSTPPSFLQTLRLLEAQLVLVSQPRTSSTGGGEGEAERLVLVLCRVHQDLARGRVVTPLHKTASRPTPTSRVYYRLSLLWPLLSHLERTLRMLDDIVLRRHSPILPLLTYTTPRRLFLHVLRGLLEFREWLLSTVHTANLPPPEAGLGCEALQLARDAVAHLDVTCGVHVYHLVQKLDQPAQDGEWWSIEARSNRQEAADELWQMWRESVADWIPLYLSPQHLSERTARKPTTAWCCTCRGAAGECCCSALWLA